MCKGLARVLRNKDVARNQQPFKLARRQLSTTTSHRQTAVDLCNCSVTGTWQLVPQIETCTVQLSASSLEPQKNKITKHMPRWAVCTHMRMKQMQL